MEIVWSDETLQNYFGVLDYLLENWTIKQVEKFENSFDALIERLKSNKEICPKSKFLNYRICVIDEYNSLIYQEVNHIIFLITIIDNRSLNNY